MGRYCAENTNYTKKGASRGKIIGAALMAGGVVVLLFFVPYWVWTAVLSVLLISVGFLLWRFG